MTERLVDRIPFAKIITVLAIVLAISLGLCGVTLVISSGGGRGAFLSGLGILVMVALGVSVAGLVLACVVWVMVSIFGGMGNKVSQSKIFPEDADETKRNRNK